MLATKKGVNPFGPLYICLGFSIAVYNDGNWDPRYEHSYPFVHYLCEALMYRFSSVA